MDTNAAFVPADAVKMEDLDVDRWFASVRDLSLDAEDYKSTDDFAPLLNLLGVFVVKLHGMPRINELLKKNKGKALPELITCSDMAYAVALIENTARMSGLRMSRLGRWRSRSRRSSRSRISRVCQVRRRRSTRR